MYGVKSIFAMLLTAAVSLLTAQSVSALTFISAQEAHDRAAAGDGIIIDVRTVEEHNGCNQNWTNPEGCGPFPLNSHCSSDCTEDANRGSPEWVDTATGVTRQAPIVPFWIGSTDSDTDPESSYTYEGSFMALEISGVINLNTPIYLICRIGYRSYYGGLYLEGLGYNFVYSVDGPGVGTDPIDLPGGSGFGGMYEWTNNGLGFLPVHYHTVIDRGGHGPQIYSIEPVDGSTVTGTGGNRVTFTALVLEPRWGRYSWVYPDVVRVSLYIDGAEVDFSIDDTTSSATSYTFIRNLPNDTYTWNIRAETEDGFSGVQVSWNPHADAIGPGDRTLTVNVTAPYITVTDSMAPNDDLDIPFGDILEGTSSDQTVTITNDGPVDLNVSSIQITGTDAVEFSFDVNGGINPCGSTTPTIIAGSNCTVTVTFSPASTGPKSAALDITSDDPDDNTVTVTVSGTGTAAAVPDIDVTDSVALDNDLQMPFGDITEGTSSAEETVTISNAGTADLDVYNIEITGTNAMEFGLDLNGGINPCGSTTPTIIAGSNCTVTVTFSPVSTGPKSAAIDITSDDPDEGTVNVALSGTGLSSAANNLPSAFQLVYPSDSERGLGTTIEFRWKKSTDPDGDTVIYDLYICKDDAFTIGCITKENIASLENRGIFYAGIGVSGAGILLFGIALASGVSRRRRIALLIGMIILTGMLLVSCGSSDSGSSSGGGNTADDEVSYTVFWFAPGTQYYWKVVADDGNGGQTESEIRNFRTR